MEVTKIKYFPIDRTSETHPLVACSITFDNVFMIHDVKVFSGGIVVMPQRGSGKSSGGGTSRSSRDLCHPIDRDFFFRLKEVVIEGYNSYKETGEACYFPSNLA